MKDKKMKKIFKFAVSIVILSTVSCICFFAGNSFGMKQKVSSNSTKINEKDDTNQAIAVVNLDEGTVLENSEKIYYGEKVIQFPDESFVYTSLEDARQGIENGNYGAYIIIPSTFSENIDSLNQTPTQANLKYALNTDLEGVVQKDVLYKVLNFGEILNTDISYMYLANILQEFHQAQDETATVMANDLKDKNSIEQIQASDLVEMVNIPELEREENTLTALDVTEYMTTNSSLVSNIDEQYKSNIDDSMEQLTNLSSNGKTLSETLTSLSGDVGQIDLETDEKGNVVYEKGILSLVNNLSEYNASLQTSKTNTLTEADELEEQRNYIATALNTSIQKYNEQLSNEIGELLSNHKTDLRVSIPAVTCVQVDNSNGKQYKITCSSIEGEDIPPAVTVSIVSDDLEEVAKRKECLNAILNKLSTAEAETENKEVTLEEPTPEEPTPEEPTPEEPTPEEPTPEEPAPEEPTPEEPTPEESETDNSVVTITGTVEVSKSVATTFEECDADTDLLQLINECGYNSALEYLKNVIEGNVSLEPTTHLEFEGSMEELETYIKLGMEHVNTDIYQVTSFAGNTFDENGNTVLDDNSQPIIVSTLLESYKDQMLGIKPKISSIAELNSQAVKDIVNNDCVTPLLARTEKVKKIFEQRYTNETTEIGTYQNLLAAYNPVKDTSKVDEYVSQMETNGSTMQENVRENNQDYVDYTEKVYTTTEENLTTLKSHVEEAKEISENAVASGLADAQSTKATTSKENQQMMTNFAAKLPYTRLGTMEYTQAYEFIADPLKLMQVSNYQRLKDDVSIMADTDTSQSTTNSQSVNTENYVKWLLYILLGVLVVLVIINLVLQSKKNGKNNPEYIGN